MSDDFSWAQFYATLVPALPLALLAFLGLCSLIDRRPSEKLIGALTISSSVGGLLFTLVVAIFMLASGDQHVEIAIGEWVAIPHYNFAVKLNFDRLSVAFVLLTFVLCGVIGSFATRYLHRERGYNRFFVLFALFQAGMVIASLADTIGVLFVGWEMVGLSSALLVAFFQERSAPPRQGLHIWIVYRISDAALLSAAIAMHHLAGSGDFDHLFGESPWPHEDSPVTPTQGLVVGLLILVAAAGKSALIPFSGWLPRAMEGPTPSSAVFYGALSVHLGAYLLLRASPLLDASPLLSGIVVALGLLTAIYAYLVGSVQTDIKSALSYASLVQVGLIVAEIGFGWRYIALAHIVGNACLRTVQFLRAPTLLHDYHTLTNALGDHLHPPGGVLGRLLPSRFQLWLYRFAMERGYLDSFLIACVVTPFVRIFQGMDALERRWTRLLRGQSKEQVQ
jgi:NAD(P)H-quinone oxidoreductase subunit 5